MDLGWWVVPSVQWSTGPWFGLRAVVLSPGLEMGSLKLMGFSLGLVV